MGIPEIVEQFLEFVLAQSLIIATRMCLSIPYGLLLLSVGFRMFSV